GPHVPMKKPHVRRVRRFLAVLLMVLDSEFGGGYDGVDEVLICSLEV
ncbi:hypothetical protein A2U01_0107740, partial [Trifolium medium]|nr:hypothetical protein [Trifolium medium]